MSDIGDIEETGPAAQAVVDALTPRQWDELADVVLRRIERNVHIELARRGRRREGSAIWR